MAAELLGELTRPAIRDLAVQFRGLRVARVYPDKLPNLPAGSQQILIGRYLPAGSDQQGEVTVTVWPDQLKENCAERNIHVLE